MAVVRREKSSAKVYLKAVDIRFHSDKNFTESLIPIL
jgi:hypothetical protein